MTFLRRLFPSMFHRRLLLLGGVVVLMCGVLSAQLVRLTLLEHRKRLADAESALQTTWTKPTIRGRIVDRKGRVLAEDQPGWEVKVDYRVINGDWAFDEASREAKSKNRQRWAKLGPYERYALTEQYLPQFREREEQLWRLLCRTADIGRDELEQRKRAIVRRVQMIRATVFDSRAARLAELTDEPITLDRVAGQIREERTRYALVSDVSEATAMRLRKQAEQHPGLTVEPTKVRVYALQRATVEIDRSRFPFHLARDMVQVVPVDHLLTHVVGSMRDVWAEDVTGQLGRPYRRADKSIDLGGYLPGDRVGKRGVEQFAEGYLRGIRGQVTTQLDTGEQTVVDPVPGRDVRLTIDAALQARLRALLDPELGLMAVQDWHRNENAGTGTPLNGSAVVLEVDSGHVLAMVGSPTMPIELAVDLPEQGDWPTKWDRPGVCRPVASVYPPGSTLKPIVYSIAAGTRAIQHDQVFTCNGHLLPDKPHSNRCWGWRPREGKYLKHGPLAPAEAIARSCNIFFYTCGKRLGPDRLCEGLYRWGCGDPTGVGMAEEVGGFVPSLDGDNPPGRGLTQHNAILIGIGQGPVSATVLQVACAHAALARGGYWLSPVLMSHRQSEQVGRDLGLHQRVVENALQGMHESANAAHGTGHHITHAGERFPLFGDFDGLTIRAKTGTAQAPVFFDDANRNGRIDEDERVIRRGPHSWFVTHVQKSGDERASVVIALIVEHGGSGGRVAGPIMQQFIRALQAEGYL